MRSSSSFPRAHASIPFTLGKLELERMNFEILRPSDFLSEKKKKYDDEKSLIEAKSHLEEALKLTKSTGDVSRQEKVTKALDEF